MKKFNKKKLKGMTLVEVLVSLAIFVIMAGVLVTACMAVNNAVTNSNRMTKKINFQAPSAENMTEDNAETSPVEININGVNVDMTLYTVNRDASDPKGNTTSGDFKYFKYSDETTPTTTPTPPTTTT